MAETKEQKEARETAEAYEKKQTESGKEVYLPRAGEPGAPAVGKQPAVPAVDGKENPKK